MERHYKKWVARQCSYWKYKKPDPQKTLLIKLLAKLEKYSTITQLCSKEKTNSENLQIGFKFMVTLEKKEKETQD